MNINERVLKEADYILKTKDTIRQLANIFCISKSTVHKDLKERLKHIDYEKYIEVKKIMEYHIMIRHIRGGESTKNKYLKTG
ncbi:stage III sporulation protein D [bacterium]|nr:stage III sporulation protein D [bacterium]